VTVETNGTITYTPDANWSGTDTFDYTISDGNGGTDTATETITVNLVPAPQLLLNKTAILNDGGDGLQAGDTIVYDFNVTNTGNVPITNILLNDVRIGVTDMEVGDLAVGESREVNATYYIVDEDLRDGNITNSAKVVGQDSDNNDINDTSDNNTPDDDEDGNGDAGDDATITLLETQPPLAVDDNATGTVGSPVVVDILANDTDTNHDINASTVDIITAGATDADGDGDKDTLVVSGEGEWHVDNANGKITFDPEEGFYDDPTLIAYTVDDKTGHDSNKAVVCVRYLKHAPVAVDDQVTISAGEPMVVNVLDNDTDQDNNIDPATVSIVSDSAIDTDGDGDNDRWVVSGEGIWSVDENGAMTFAPDAGFDGDPTPIQYTVTDSTNQTSNAATVRIATPPRTGDDEQVIVVGEEVEVSILENDASDVDPTSVSLNADNVVGAVSEDTDHDGDTDRIVVSGEGVWSVDDYGVVTFAPESHFKGSPTSITYTVQDRDGHASEAAEITLVAGPVAYDDSVNVSLAESITVAVLDNDDKEMDISTVSLVSDGIPGSIATDTDGDGDIDMVVVPDEGVWRVDDDGEVTFEPYGGLADSPTPIQYTVRDTRGYISNVATIIIHTQPTAIDAVFWVDSNGNGKKDEDEKAIVGAKVELLNTEGNTVVCPKAESKQVRCIATTDRQGKYRFENLPASKYKLRFTLPQSMIEDGYVFVSDGEINDTQITVVADTTAMLSHAVHVGAAVQCGCCGIVGDRIGINHVVGWLLMMLFGLMGGAMLYRED
jgi:CshA-type fibril repeat protein